MSAAWDCRKCGARNVGAQETCLACGEARLNPCATCGGRLPSPDAAFCPGCGNPVAVPTPRVRHCVHCSAALPEEARFCPVCGKATRPAERPPRKCSNPSCRAVVIPEAAFCAACGQPAGPAVEERRAARPAARPAQRPAVRPAAPPPGPPPTPKPAPPPVPPPTRQRQAATSKPKVPAQRVCPNPQCGRTLPPGKKFCTGCGTAL